MATLIEVIIAGVPVAKGRARVGKFGTYTPAKTKAFEAHGRLVAQQAMASQTPLEGPLRMDVWPILPVPRSWSQKRQHLALRGDIKPVTRPDVDNYAKAALDLCNGIVFADDSQVTTLHITKAYGPEPMLKIHVRNV